MLELEITYRCTQFDHSIASAVPVSCMHDAHQNLNGSCDLTTPLLGMFYHPWARTGYINLPSKFEASISAHYEDMKRDPKCGKWGALG